VLDLVEELGKLGSEAGVATNGFKPDFAPARPGEVIRNALDPTKARDELGFELREVAIDGNPELEAAYREWIPVVEIDGRRRFVYHVHPDALRRALAQAGS
jgi:hypothetical protein